MDLINDIQLLSTSSKLHAVSYLISVAWYKHRQTPGMSHPEDYNARPHILAGPLSNCRIMMRYADCVHITERWGWIK